VDLGSKLSPDWGLEAITPLRASASRRLTLTTLRSREPSPVSSWARRPMSS